jgi:drug/metabolite transporter (DMT)-like permease
MSKLTAILLVLLSTLFWGINFHAGKYVVGFISPLDAAAIRFSLASVVILVMLLVKESPKTVWAAIEQQWKAYIVLGIIGVAGFNGLFFLGLKYTSAVNGALILATNPLVTVLMSAFILKESIRMNQYIGMCLSLMGVILVITQGKWVMLRHFQIASGDWIIMGANVCFALYGVLCRRYLQESKPLITTAMTMIIGAVTLLLCVGLAPSSSAWIHQNWPVYAALLHMALFGTVLAYLFWNSGIIYLGINQTVIFFNLVPVFTVLIAMMLGQPILLIQILGGISVLLGVLISTQFFVNRLQLLLNGR